MAETTGIEWCDATFNPWTGCTKISPGCDSCYAEGWAKRSGIVKWGVGAARRRTSAGNWRKPLTWNAAVFYACSECGWRGESEGSGCPDCAAEIHTARRRVFCASLADVFDNAVDDEWRADLFQLIEATPKLDWLLLTKRIGNVESLVPEATDLIDYGEGWQSLWGQGQWPANVWLGATVVNQEEANRDIPKLLAIPARVRFLSCEPLLEPVTIFDMDGPIDVPDGAASPLHWVISGGESGGKARPSHPDWHRSLRDQCVSAGVAYLFKQWGEWGPHRASAGGDEGGDLRRGHVRYLQGDGREPDGHFRKGDAAVARVGKKAAGRMLDGRTHDEFPS